jgi:hypothetical protein
MRNRSAVNADMQIRRYLVYALISTLIEPPGNCGNPMSFAKLIRKLPSTRAQEEILMAIQG